jgi:AP-4 complex subunit epsilon-1
MALLIVTQLINKDLMLALLPLIVKAMDHAQVCRTEYSSYRFINRILNLVQANVRKKAVVALHRCYQISPELVEPHIQRVHRVLCDKDPSVMGASLPFFLELASRLYTCSAFL